MPSTQSMIEKAVLEMENLTPFSIYDFKDYGSYEAVKKALLRLEERRLTERIINGLYFKKDLSVSKPDINETASAIARMHGWGVSPTGEEFLFRLSLRDIQAERNTYLSTGVDRVYEIFDDSIKFVHSPKCDILGLSRESLTAVQALKAIGRDNIKKDDLEKIGHFLSHSDKIRIERECRKCTKWVYSTILTILMDYTERDETANGVLSILEIKEGELRISNKKNLVG